MKLPSHSFHYQMQFSLRQLVVAITLIAITLGLGVRIWRCLNGNYDELKRRFHNHRAIYDVTIGTIEQGLGDFAIDVYDVRFKIAGRKDTLVAINTPELDLFEDAKSICIDRMGDVSITATYIDEASGFNGTGGVDVSLNSDLREVLPCTVRNLDELVERYDELLAGFRTWPTYDDPGVVRMSPTITIKYWAQHVSASFDQR